MEELTSRNNENPEIPYDLLKKAYAELSILIERLNEKLELAIIWSANNNYLMRTGYRPLLQILIRDLTEERNHVALIIHRYRGE